MLYQKYVHTLNYSFSLSFIKMFFFFRSNTVQAFVILGVFLSIGCLVIPLIFSIYYRRKCKDKCGKASPEDGFMDYLRLSLAGRNVVSQNKPLDTSGVVTSGAATSGAATPGVVTTGAATAGRVCSVFTLSEGSGPSSASDYTPTTKPRRKIKNKHRKKPTSNFWSRKVPSNFFSTKVPPRQLSVVPDTPATTAGARTGSATGSNVASTPCDSQQPSSVSYSSASISLDNVHPSDANTAATLSYSYNQNPFVLINDTLPPVNLSVGPPLLLQDVINDGLEELRVIAGNIDPNTECETNVDDEFSQMAKSRSNTPDRDSKQ
jgi:hypothetical protein